MTIPKRITKSGRYRAVIAAPVRLRGGTVLRRASTVILSGKLLAEIRDSVASAARIDSGQPKGGGDGVAG